MQTDLTENLAKWNELYLKSLEPRLVSTATSLANIDSNIKNLQERAHVWDTFQLHVTAWNDQLAILDRKVDIISKYVFTYFNKINFYFILFVFFDLISY